jgi:hypothetical protein
MHASGQTATCGGSANSNRRITTRPRPQATSEAINQKRDAPLLGTMDPQGYVVASGQDVLQIAYLGPSTQPFR